MSGTDYKDELPALRLDDRDLPIPVAGTQPTHKVAEVKAHNDWFNLASQRFVRDVAINATCDQLWLATGGGLLRWWLSQQQYTRYSSEHGLAGNSIMSVAIDGAGRTWAVPQLGGLYYFDGEIWHPYLELGEIDTTIYCVTIDRTGRLWAAATDMVFAVAHPNQAPVKQLPFAGDPPRTLSVTEESDAWLCNALGVQKFQDNGWTVYIQQPSILTFSRQGDKLWLGTMNGLIQIDLTTNQSYRAKKWPVRAVTALAPTEEGIWVSCSGEIGLATESDWFPLRSKRLESTVTSIASDSDGGVWIGSHEGLLHGDGTGIQFYLTSAPPDVIGLYTPLRSPPLLSNLVQALAAQQIKDRSILWIGTSAGLFRLDFTTQSWRQFFPSGPHDIRAILAENGSEDVWIGSWSGGLQSVKEKSAQIKDSLVPGPVLALCNGPNSIHWAAGLEGLYRHNGGNWSLELPATELSSAGWISVINQTRAERLWLGTTTGLYSYHPQNKTLLPVDSLPANTHVRAVLTMSYDDEELLWVATDKGLYGNHPDQLEAFPELTGWTVSTLVWDSNSQIIWLGTDKGLFGLTKKKTEWHVRYTHTAQNSGLGADRIRAMALGRSESSATSLWIGTIWGISCYSY